MARGKYWEITHDPDHDDPTETVKLSDLEGVTGWDNRTIVGDGANPVTVRFRVSDPARHFERCNFTARVVDSNIANWHFNRCTFKGSKWENVKFSRCVFTEFEPYTYLHDVLTRLPSMTNRRNRRFPVEEPAGERLNW